MNSRLPIKLLFVAIAVLPVSRGIGADQHYDVVIYGGTSAAVATAVQVKRMGKSVVIVSPDVHLGGLTSGGLGWTDSGNKDAIGGISREFYHYVWKHYQTPDAWTWAEAIGVREPEPGKPGKNGDGATMWVFEPHVAEQIYERMILDHEIPVHLDQWLDRSSGVEVDRGRIKRIQMLSGDAFTGKMFVDATYEGDLLAAAGVDYHVGREANAQYGETWNGIQVGVLHHSHHFKNQLTLTFTLANRAADYWRGLALIRRAKRVRRTIAFRPTVSGCASRMWLRTESRSQTRGLRRLTV